MALPLIPIIAALMAGGTLVPHAAGGMIVTSAAGYVAGTYLSTAAIGGLLATATAVLGSGALYLSGLTGTILGGAGIFGTSYGASGIIGFLMSVGLIATVPKWIPLLVGLITLAAAVGLGYGAYRLFKLKQKIKKTTEGKEAHFTENEAKVVEKIIKRLNKKRNIGEIGWDEA